MAKNTGKVREKSGNFVSPEKWEPCLIVNVSTARCLLKIKMDLLFDEQTVVEGSPERDGPSDILCLLAMCTSQESEFILPQSKTKWFVPIMFLFNMKSL